MKRNSVVIDKDKDLFNFYKRVWKVVDEETVITICCGLHVKLEKKSDLELVNYTGRYDGKHFLGMSRLRSLLKGARRYNPELIPGTKE
jgi:hypothetical protein